jgi:hypothetical protein
MGVNQYFKIGSNVIMKRNIWKIAGIFNGSRGKIEDIIIDKNNVITSILVNFESYRGKGWLGT